MQIPTKTVGGAEFFAPEEQAVAVLASNDRAIMMTGPNAQALPMEAFATAIKSGKGGLEKSDEMKKLIAGVDTTQPLWAVLKMTDTFRQAPVFSAFDQITLVGKMKDRDIDIQVDGQGQNAAQVAAAVDQLNAGVQAGINQLKPMVVDAPFLSHVVKMMEGIQCKSAGEKATLSVSIKADAATLIVPMYFGERMAAPPPVAPPAPP